MAKVIVVAIIFFLFPNYVLAIPVFECGIYRSTATIAFKKSINKEKLEMPILILNNNSIKKNEIPLFMPKEDQLYYESLKQKEFKRVVEFEVLKNTTNPNYVELVKMSPAKTLNKHNMALQLIERRKCKNK